MLVRHSIKEPLDILLGTYDAWQAENLDRGIVGVNTHVHVALLANRHDSLEECNMNMCVHPDDPPIEILGLPRIVRTEEDIQWFLDAVPNKHNGLTFCAGSLSAGAYNNVVELAKKFASRTHFVHLRSCHIFPNGDFTEASHLGGRADLIELCRIFEKENPELPMRVDHGMTFTDEPGGIMDESSHGHNAGYTLLGRMFAMGQVQGILATVDRELGIEYKQPGFFD